MCCWKPSFLTTQVKVTSGPQWCELPVDGKRLPCLLLFGHPDDAGWRPAGTPHTAAPPSSTSTLSASHPTWLPRWTPHLLVVIEHTPAAHGQYSPAGRSLWFEEEAETLTESSYNESTQCEGYLLGEGGVCIEPALGVLESWPADWFSPLRLNGGAALLFMPRMGNPNAPTERASRQAWKTKLTLPRFLWDNITVMSRHYSAETGQCLSVLLCGPYRLAPSCDSWPVEEAEEDASIWGGQTHNHTDQNTETHTAAADAAACSVTVNHSGKLWRALCCIPGQWGQSEDE